MKDEMNFLNALNDLEFDVITAVAGVNKYDTRIVVNATIKVLRDNPKLVGLLLVENTQ